MSLEESTLAQAVAAALCGETTRYAEGVVIMPAERFDAMCTIGQAAVDAHPHHVAMYAAVRAMRGHQRDYFATRRQDSLVESKRREREVDRLLAELDKPQGGHNG